ncbi:Splicing factor [Salix suchowensis]|nr:Splicing factor [Salix suchowensis]
MTALGLAALAEAAAPYGIESFDNVLKPLWLGIRLHRGKGYRFIIPLMDPEYASYYTKEVTVILIREFQTSDEEMKKIVLKVVKQCAATEGVTAQYIKQDILPDFFRPFGYAEWRWIDETTNSEPYRKMVMETITKVVATLGASDIDERLEVRLVDGIIYSFQEQTTEDQVMLDGFGTVVNALAIPNTNCFNHPVAFEQQERQGPTTSCRFDYSSRHRIKQCGEDQLLSKLGLVLFEQLGEEYPDTLGSIIAAEGAIANVVGMTQMNPPVKDLLPRMTPILRNRHEKAHKKGIRRAAVNSFGYIAKSLGPQDVLSVLLTNLRVQERQSRVCTTVAIGIVAETCGPFTCIPAILNEYRTAELNVRTGCLKALSFVFEYVGPQSSYYCDSVVTMLEDALTDRDLVHRQTASTIVKHLALGVAGLGCEDSMMHLMNLADYASILQNTGTLYVPGIKDCVSSGIIPRNSKELGVFNMTPSHPHGAGRCSTFVGSVRVRKSLSCPGISDLNIGWGNALLPQVLLAFLFHKDTRYLFGVTLVRKGGRSTEFLKRSPFFDTHR